MAGQRVLVIDNYDSFTANLVQSLWCFTGTEPVVVRNDDAGWRPEDLAGFDCVVISPGPGRPDRPADFGICPAVIAAARVPLLGVCLGHQGICHAFGGTVTAAPEPVHGRTSLVWHDGRELFAGIPSPFLAVRYHSLMVGQIPAALEVNAASDDGVPMALRHRERPLWGVQFHPESACTEHGQRLLANFVNMAVRQSACTEHGDRLLANFVNMAVRQSACTEHGDRLLANFVAMAKPTASPRQPHRCDNAGPIAPSVSHRWGDVEGAADRRGRKAGAGSAAAGADLRVLARRVRCEASAESVFDALYRYSDHSFWLDSGMRQGGSGRFSFMGDATGPLARTVTADVSRGVITVTNRAEVARYSGSFFDWLSRDLSSRRAEVPPLPFDFALGWVGYLGYQLKAETGGKGRHRSPHPDASMIFADRAVAFDHETGEVYLLALADARADPAIAWLDATERRLASLRPGPARAHPGNLRPGEPDPAARGLGQLRLRHGRAAYLDMIAACQRLIRAGETYEVCLTNMIEVPGTLEVWPAYRSLRRDNPVPYGALLRFGGLSVLSASPERFLRIDRSGVVESKPVKGTRPRGRCPAEDERLRAELAACEKERAENLMIVDLVRNDLGVTAVPGSVQVERIFDVETFSSVHQLVSTVRSRLRPGVSAVDCMRAAFPGGSMTGAPKIATMRIIDDLEAGPRGVYSGAIGYLSLSGAADLSITIRTLVVTPELVRFGVGGAITALSDPDAEFEETAVKAAPLLRLLGQGFPERHAVSRLAGANVG